MAYDKEKNYYLDDLPLFLNSISSLSVHGKGKGGGEVVIEKILVLYSDLKKNVNISRISGEDGFLKRFLFIFNTNKRETILLTAGVRDIDLIFFCFLLNKKAFIYNQVPYLKAASKKKDIVHYLLVRLYVFLLKLKIITIFTNSKSCITIKGKDIKVILPILKKEQVISPAQHLSFNTSLINFGTAFRLNTERGRGSKDIEGLVLFCKQMDQVLKKKGINFKVTHFGQYEENLKLQIQNEFQNIEFKGYTSDWIENSEIDAYFFISRYEGFGLAALEASLKKPVYVNEAFPEELFSSSTNIHKLDTLFDII
jgi:hypothetical protein